MISFGPTCDCGHPVELHDDLGCTIVEDEDVCPCLVDFEQEDDAA